MPHALYVSAAAVLPLINSVRLTLRGRIFSCQQVSQASSVQDADLPEAQLLAETLVLAPGMKACSCTVICRVLIVLYDSPRRNWFRVQQNIGLTSIGCSSVEHLRSSSRSPNIKLQPVDTLVAGQWNVTLPAEHH